jgi:N-dimethylarginine dimethylaminohydrolase
MVFTANAGLLLGDQILLAYFKHPERQGETTYFRKWFQQAGYKIMNDTGENVGANSFEGAGDALLAGHKLFAGHGFRTEKRFYEQLSVVAPYELIYCELVNPNFYHIDTCFCPLNATQAIWYPGAFSPTTQKNMAANIELFAVTEQEAKRFACNAIVLNKNIILPTECPQITATLEKLGFTVHACAMTEYLKAGGACKCLTLRLD